MDSFLLQFSLMAERVLDDRILCDQLRAYRSSGIVQHANDVHSIHGNNIQQCRIRHIRKWWWGCMRHVLMLLIHTYSTHTHTCLHTCTASENERFGRCRPFFTIAALILYEVHACVLYECIDVFSYSEYRICRMNSLE